MNKWISLKNAPFDTPLMLANIENDTLAARLQHIGLYEQTEIIRLDESLEVHSLRIRGPRGDVILGGGMGVKTIVHLDDGRRLPLIDMEPGDTGHIEGFTGGTSLVHTLEVLGFREDSPITLIRKLPPMDYITLILKGDRIRLSEGDAAKLWGSVQDVEMQYSLAPVEKEFIVKEILGGKRAQERIRGRGIRPGSILMLEGVEQAQSVQLTRHGGLVISTRDGLHLHLPEGEGDRIWLTQE